MTGFAAVEIRPEALAAPQVTGRDGGANARDSAQPWRCRSPTEAAPLPAMPGLIEVELPTGVRLRVGTDVDGPALRRVLAALAGAP